MTFPAATNLRWVDAASVTADARLNGLTLPNGISVDMIVQMATEILFLRSGCRYNQSVTTIRPAHLSADCGNLTGGLGLGPSWGGAVGAGWFGSSFPEGLGCTGSAREFVLPGNGPILPGTVSVTVDGAPLVAQGQAGEQWHLYGGRRLVRMFDATGATVAAWPCCQLLSRPLGQPGTWSVTYSSGTPVTAMGQAAAYDLSVEFCLAYGSKTGKLPANASRGTRQGVTVEILPTAATFQEALPSKIANDWLASCNPHGNMAQARVSSIDRVRGFSG